jgi:hypothetical protein
VGTPLVLEDVLLVVLFVIENVEVFETESDSCSQYKAQSQSS